MRLEAPTDVDDIVVRQANGHRDWIQVKLDLDPRGNSWEKPWTDLAQQVAREKIGLDALDAQTPHIIDDRWED
ncbi:hypothetical protein [Novosphingobium sp. PY1]|uniref:hypothetical protein n=1 Tax=Novosphingobium sp. PY1 TaxID=1882221 RepID=UPI001A8EB031|nr:hypothetical protein [Novosphingobium sp. PY1]